MPLTCYRSVHSLVLTLDLPVNFLSVPAALVFSDSIPGSGNSIQHPQYEILVILASVVLTESAFGSWAGRWMVWETVASITAVKGRHV